MKNVVVYSQRYPNGAAFVADEPLVRCLGKLCIKMMAENNPRLEGLPETRALVLKFMPKSLKTSVENCIVDYFSQTDELLLEGFVTFMLKRQSQMLDSEISGILGHAAFMF